MTPSFDKKKKGRQLNIDSLGHRLRELCVPKFIILWWGWGHITHGYTNGFHVRQIQIVFLTDDGGAADSHDKSLHVIRNIQMLNYTNSPLANMIKYNDLLKANFDVVLLR